NILGAYLAGRQAPVQMALQQQELARGSQGLEMGGLQMEQLRQVLKGRQLMAEAWGGGSTGPASPSMGRTGGVQDGPQGAVGGTAQGAPQPLQATPYGGVGGMGSPGAPLAAPSPSPTTQ